MAAVTPDEIERKLEQLRRIAGVEPASGSSVSQPAPAEPAPPPPAAEPVETSTELAELSKLVGRMEVAAASFATQVGALSERFAQVVSALDRNAQAQPVTPSAPSAAPPAAAREPVAAEPEPQASPPRDEIEIEVGPFGDITQVSSFVQALAEVEGVNDVYVRGFESANALLEVRLQGEVDLADAMLAAMPGELELRAIDDARVSVAINAEARTAVE